MMKNLYISIILLFTGTVFVQAGNPERAGQAGATQLLINSWARSSGMNGMNYGSGNGIEALGTNPAGLATTRRTELVFAHNRWLVGSDIGINSFGFSQGLKKAGVIGLFVNAFDMGEFERTTPDNPDGGLGTFKPIIMNMGVAYAKKFTDHIYVGATVKVVHEAIPDASATGVAFDAGVQYRTNFGKTDSLHSDRLKIGITIRNIGTNMSFTGDGLKYRAALNGNNFTSQLERSTASYEMPSQLCMGLSYDFHFAQSIRLSALGSFISNSFSYDQFAGGVELSFKELLFLRYSLRYEKGVLSEADTRNAFSGHAMGATVEIPFKSGKNYISHVGIDYSYRSTYFFSGTHSIGIRIDL